MFGMGASGRVGPFVFRTAGSRDNSGLKRVRRESSSRTDSEFLQVLSAGP